MSTRTQRRVWIFVATCIGACIASAQAATRACHSIEASLATSIEFG